MVAVSYICSIYVHKFSYSSISELIIQTEKHLKRFTTFPPDDMNINLLINEVKNELRDY